MKLFRGIDSYSIEQGAVVTIGSFDGLHGGHSSILTLLRDRAETSNIASVVISFSPHPRVALGRAEGLKLLTSDAEKRYLLSESGIDALLLLEFDDAFSKLSYEEFVVDYLLRRVNMKELIVGFNHHIGHNGGDYSSLTKLAQKENFEVILAKEYNCGERISSTRIRGLIELGDIEAANRLLSHNYPIFGQTTLKGEMIIDEPLKLVPPPGRYLVTIDGSDSIIEIDDAQRIWCCERDKNIEIKLKKKV
ncbi:MAG: FAD synthetase [Rikenellaceae bacterium]